MPGAALYLTFVVGLLKLVAVAPELARCDVLPGLFLLAGEKSRLAGDFNFDGEVVRHDVDRPEVSQPRGRRGARRETEARAGFRDGGPRSAPCRRV